MKVKRLTINGTGFQYNGNSTWSMYANGETHHCVTLSTKEMCEYYLKYNILRVKQERD